MARGRNPKKKTTKKKRFFVKIGDKKMYLDEEVIQKYHVREGDYLPFTSYEIYIEK